MSMRRNKGFTLVELAVVLVIIGILLGAVLKGSELIKNSKEKRVYSSYRELVAAINTYVDRYGSYPGDDPKASDRWSGQPDGNQNGFIDNPYYNCTDSSTYESCYMWQHLRKANLINGDSTSRINMKHVYDRNITVGWNPVYGLYDHWVYYKDIPEEAALAIDEKYDDGTYNTGAIRASGNDYNLDDTGYMYRDFYIRGI